MTMSGALVTMIKTMFWRIGNRKLMIQFGIEILGKEGYKLGKLDKLINQLLYGPTYLVVKPA